MTPLTQQLEDKKKELLELTKEAETINEVINNNEGNIDAGMENDIIKIENKIVKLQAEIAILEQAIAEIKSKDDKIFELECKYKRAMEGWVDNANLLQKQRQETLEEFAKIVKDRFCEDGLHREANEKKLGPCNKCKIINKIIEQLNQPKTEETKDL